MLLTVGFGSTRSETVGVPRSTAIDSADSTLISAGAVIVGAVVSSTDYVVIVKCSQYTSGTYTPKLGTAFNGTITGVGITVHEITANGTGFDFVTFLQSAEIVWGNSS